MTTRILLCLAAFAAVAGAADVPQEEKPVFTCVVNGDKIEVFARSAPFESAKHVFQRVGENEFGHPQWLVDGQPLRGDNLMIRWDGCPAMAEPFDPAKFTSMMEHVEVRWNGKPGQVVSPEAICFNPALSTDLGSERH